jgi:hypothetical protein
MPALTRRRYPERQDYWHVYFGDVHVGTIASRVGQPHDEDPWQWLCGFYPGSDPGEQTTGTAATLSKPVRILRSNGGGFQLDARRPIIKPGGISATGRPGNTACGRAASGFRSPTVNSSSPKL